MFVHQYFSLTFSLEESQILRELQHSYCTQLCFSQAPGELNQVPGDLQAGQGNTAETKQLHYTYLCRCLVLL